METIEGEFITTDLGVAAYLAIILGFPQEFDRRDQRKVKFVFSGDKEFIESKYQDYREGRARVDAKTMAEMIRSLKRTVCK